MNKPKICDILGLNIGTKFKIYGEIGVYRIECDGKITESYNNVVVGVISGDVLLRIIQNPNAMVIEISEKELTIAKGLIEMGYGYIARDFCGCLYAYDGEPINIKKDMVYEYANGSDPIRIQDENIFSNIKYESGVCSLKKIIRRENADET